MLLVAYDIAKYQDEGLNQITIATVRTSGPEQSSSHKSVETSSSHVGLNII